MTRKTKLVASACVLVLAVAGAWMLLRERKSAEEQILESIMGFAEAVEARDVAGCIQHFSPDYRDNQGNTRVILRRLASEGLREASSIDVSLYEPEVSVDGREATAKVEAEVTTVSSTGKHHWPLKLTFTYKLERRRWRITRADGWHHLENEW
jgi:ketosteroid isomerase-like protein